MAEDYFDALNNQPSFVRDDSVTDYITLSDGEQIKVQLASPSKKIFKHWMNRADSNKRIAVNCLGIDRCPVCEHNAGLADGRDDEDYISTQLRYVVNVVDLSPVKYCPECGKLNPANAAQCSGEECDAILIDVETEPMNRVRYFEGSHKTFKKLEAVMAVLPEGSHINEFPIIISRTGSGRDTDYHTFPVMNERGAINVEDYQDQLFDLDDVGISLDYNEMTTLMNGGSFSAIMEARQATKESRKEEVDNIFS